MKQNDHDPNEIIRRYVVVRREDYNDFIFRTAQKHRFVSQALRAAMAVYVGMDEDAYQNIDSPGGWRGGKAEMNSEPIQEEK